MSGSLRLRWSWAWVLLGAWPRLGFAGPAPAARADKAVFLDGVVAVVNDEIILRSDLDRATDRHPLWRETLSQLPANTAESVLAQKRQEAENLVLDELIHLVLARAEAVRLDIRVSEDEVNRSVPRIAAQYNLTVEELRKQVEASEDYASWQEYLDDLRDQLIQLRVSQALASWEVSEAQVREYYRKMSKDESAKVEVEQFNVVPASADKADRDRAFGRSQALARRLREGAQGEVIAAELGRSETQWRRTVGRGDVPPTIEDAVFSAKNGAVVGPLASGQGYVVFRVVEHQESAAVAYEQAKDKIREQLEGEAYVKAEQNLRTQLRARAHVQLCGTTCGG